MAKTNYSIVNLSKFSNELKYRTEESIDVYRRFTHVPSNGARKIKPRSIVFVLNTEEKLSFVGRLKRSPVNVATGQRRLRGDNFYSINEININNLPDDVSKLLSNYLSRSTSHLSEKAGSVLRTFLEATFPNLHDAFNQLDKLIHTTSTVLDDPRELVLEEQKDAVVLAMKVAGMLDIEKEAASKRVELKTKSFLESIGGEKLSEDRIVEHDSGVFSDWSKEEHRTISSGTEFRQGAKRITVFSANRRPLEEVFGVDLIYVDAPSESATFVQYKIMDRQDSAGNSYFYPKSGNHDKELVRMKSLSSYLEKNSKNNGSLTDLRVNISPLFFKLCTASNLKKDENNVAVGMYIPLDYWNVLLNCPETLGPNGGVQIGFHTAGDRYFTTTQFVELLKKNLIGTRSDVWGEISKWIRQSLNANRSVVIAIKGEISH